MPRVFKTISANSYDIYCLNSSCKLQVDIITYTVFHNFQFQTAEIYSFSSQQGTYQSPCTVHPALVLSPGCAPERVGVYKKFLNQK